MTVTETASRTGPVSAPRSPATGVGAVRPPRDLQRTFQLVLATVWLLDAVLQIQPFMFTKGANGFSGMLNGTADGNPSWIAHTITWNGSIVYHQPILTNTVFAGIQFLIAFGLIYKRTLKPALALSIAWSARGLVVRRRPGRGLLRRCHPLRRWPRRCALLRRAGRAALAERRARTRPFVAARTVGVRAAKAIWAVMWLLLAVLCLVGPGARRRRSTTWWPV